MDRRRVLKSMVAGIAGTAFSGKVMSNDIKGEISSSQHAMTGDARAFVLLSSFFVDGVSDDDIFSMALNHAEDDNGCHNKIIINDTDRVFEIKKRHLIKGSNNTSLKGIDKFNGITGIIGCFRLVSGGGFDFYKCQYPKIRVVIDGGSDNKLSDIAVRMEGLCMNPSFKIIGNNYDGYLFGTLGAFNDSSSMGVQCVDDSKISAHSCGGAFIIKNTTGFGTINTVWEEYSKGSSVLEKSKDVSIITYENFIPNSLTGDLIIKQCGSITIGSLLTGAWGRAQVKIYDSQTVAIANHLSVLGNIETNKEDVFAIDIMGSVVSIGNSRLEKSGSGYRIGYGSFVQIDNLTANLVNQIAELSNIKEYNGFSKSRSASFIVKSGRAFLPNGKSSFISKDLIYVDENVNSGKLSVNGLDIVKMNYNRVNDFGRFLNCKSRSHEFKILINNSEIDFTGNISPFYIENVDSLLSFSKNSFEGEIEFQSYKTSGNGSRIEMNNDNFSLGSEITYKGILPKKIGIHFEIKDGGFMRVELNEFPVLLEKNKGENVFFLLLRTGDRLFIDTQSTVIKKMVSSLEL